MTKAHSILVAVDGSDAARRALAYVGEIVGPRPDTTLRLLHLLPPTPPEYLEHGGAEHPPTQERLDRELREGRDAWNAARCDEAQSVFQDAIRLLESHGLVAAHIETECRPCVGRHGVARACLDAAEEGGCDTIVLARQTMPWHKEILHRHESTDVVRRGRGFAIWVVE